MADHLATCFEQSYTDGSCSFSRKIPVMKDSDAAVVIKGRDKFNKLCWENLNPLFHSLVQSKVSSYMDEP